jgi:hypothetical protein
MHTHDAERGVGAAAGEVAARAKTIARLEAKLAIAEVKEKLGALGLGIGLGVGAAIFGLFTLGFVLAAVAAAFDTFLPTWLALLITAVLCLVVTGVLALLAQRALQRATPPVPQQAIADARLTAEAVKNHGNGRNAHR